MEVNSDLGKLAISRFRVQTIYDLGKFKKLSLVSCEIETGRTHQIRVHLSSIGHPLIGDPWYGQRRPTLGMERPFLHAAQLEFDHPNGEGQVAFSSELAADLQEMLSELEPVDVESFED